EVHAAAVVGRPELALRREAPGDQRDAAAVAVRLHDGAVVERGVGADVDVDVPEVGRDAARAGDGQAPRRGEEEVVQGDGGRETRRGRHGVLDADVARGRADVYVAAAGRGGAVGGDGALGERDHAVRLDGHLAAHAGRARSVDHGGWATLLAE